MRPLAKYLIVGTLGLTTLFGLKKDSDGSLDNFLKNIDRKEIILEAKRELEKKGITSEQEKAHGFFSERAYSTIRPSLYDNSSYVKEHIKNFILDNNRFENSERLKNEYSSHSKKLQEYDKKNDTKNVKKELEKIEQLENSINYFSREDDPYSEDAWRMYLGLPMKYNTFSMSDYAPSKSSEINKYYYKLPDEFEEELLKLVIEDSVSTGDFSEHVFNGFFGENNSRARVLGNFKVGKGSDKEGKYISYYDIYDLSPKIPLIGKTPLENIIGKPFEIYNRIYYSQWITLIFSNFAKSF